MLKSIEEVYCIIDKIVQQEIANHVKIGRKSKLSVAEVITLLVEGHKRHYTTEKQLYMFASGELRSAFNQIPCYSQFTRAIKNATPYLDLVLEVITRINSKNEQKFIEFIKTLIHWY